MLTGFADSIKQGETISISSSGLNLQDLAGNDDSSLMGFAVTNHSTIDDIGPSVISAATSTDGLTIILTYDEAISAATDVGSDFYVSAGNAVTDQANFTRVTTTTVSGNTLSLVLSNAIASTDDVSIDYDDPTITGGAGVQDLAGNDALPQGLRGHQ